MPTATASLLVDLDDTLNFSTDITAYWYRSNGFDFPAQGRSQDLGLAEMGRATFLLDNRDGRFSPENSASPYAGFEFAQGSYTGNDADGRQIPVGFQPEVVIVKGDTASEGRACIRTSTMSSARQVTATGGTIRIDSLDANGFTVSYDIADSDNVNATGVTYYWWALRGAKVVTGSYVGSAPTPKAVTGVGGTPALVIVVPNSNSPVRFRTTHMTTESHNMGATAGATQEITSLDADGFTLGTNTDVNGSGLTHHYIAFLPTPGLEVGTYTGTATGGTHTISTSIAPALVSIKGDLGQEATFRTLGMGSAGSFPYSSLTRTADGILSLDASGFSIGNDADVWFNAIPYFWFAFGEGASGGFDTYHRIKATITFNAVTYNVFYGIITMIKPDPNPDLGGICTVQATDLMYMLGRAEIRAPFMAGYTGPIINRLLDYAEAGVESEDELVDNPRFDDLQLLTGYSAMGTAGIGRATTTRPILEGVASLAVSAPAANDGVRYTFPGAPHAGRKATVAVYVQAREGNDGNAYVQMQDSVGVVTTGADTPVAYGRWTRLSVSGTYSASSSAQYIQVRRSGASGSPDFVVGAVHAIPYAATIARSVDQGHSLLDSYAYRRGSALRAIQEVTTNELGALFYMDGAGNAVFHDKQHRWITAASTSVQATFDEQGLPAYHLTADDRIKAVALDFPRYVQGELTVLWKADRLPEAIPASGSLSFEIDFGGGLSRNTTLPVATTDYLANGQAEGGGTDETGNVLVTGFDDFGATCKVTFENQQTYPVYLTFFQLRGVPMRISSDRTPARAVGANGPALAATLSYTYSLNGREPHIQAWADWLAKRYDGSLPRMSLTLSSPYPTDATMMAQGLGRAIGDRINFENNTLPFALGIDRDFYIDRITRSLSGSFEEGGVLTWTWDLAPVEPETGSFFIIGSSLIGGPDVLAP